jgi:hypothetical protein
MRSHRKKEEYDMRYGIFTLMLATVLAVGSLAFAQAPSASSATAELRRERPDWEPVSGSGVHFFTTAIVHSSEPTPTGMIQRSTETVELTGDLVGRILYHPVSVFDFVEGTLVNEGHQVFSGTVLDTGPVLIHDDEFRFEVDLATGITVGEVHLVDRIAGPRTRCHLEIYGFGETTPEGDAIVEYTGVCRIQGPAS